MKVNTAVKLILAGKVVSAEDINHCLTVAVDKTKRDVLEAALAGTITPAPSKVKETSVAPAPVKAPGYGASPIGRTPEETALAVTLAAVLYADANGTRRKDRDGRTYKTSECIASMGLPTRSNPRSVKAYLALVAA